MRLPELTAEQVAPALDGELVLLDFYQATCPPCRALEPRQLPVVGVTAAGLAGCP